MTKRRRRSDQNQMLVERTAGPSTALRSVEKHFQERSAELQIPQLPGFPVEVGVISELHAAFLNESRTRGRLWCRAVGNPGCAPPGFLLRSVGSSNYMRLSSPKGAHAAVSGAA
jgi:hypothetical protein